MKHTITIKYQCPLCNCVITERFDRVRDNVMAYFCPVCVPVLSEESHIKKDKLFLQDAFVEYDEPYIFMEPIGLIQEIESSLVNPEEVVFIPSGLQHADINDDIRAACDDCNKCEDCPQMDEEDRTYKTYCSSFRPLCKTTCPTCTSILTDKLRYLEKNHFSYEENWSLDYSICKFILPRLKEFRENCIGFPSGLSEEPGGFEKWKQILRKIILFCRIKLQDNFLWISEEERKENKTFRAKKLNVYLEGRELLGKYFDTLWD